MLCYILVILSIHTRYINHIENNNNFKISDFMTNILSFVEKITYKCM